MGLSIGQREALSSSKSSTPSNLEGVMSAAGSPIPRSRTKAIDVDELVFGDDIIAPVQESEGDGTSLPGISESCPELPSTPASEPSVKQPRPTSYLNNPVASVSRWLHNQQLPSVLLKHEKVEHRIMLYLKAQGMSNREVAAYMGYSDAQVSQITRQPWFFTDLEELLKSEGRDLIKKMLEGTAIDSIIKLVELRDNAKVPAAVQMNCANSLLDRLLGKPTQEVKVEQKESPAVRASKIDGELSELETREAELRHQLNRMMPGKS